jgi:hypothetical protein
MAYTLPDDDIYFVHLSYLSTLRGSLSPQNGVSLGYVWRSHSPDMEGSC